MLVRVWKPQECLWLYSLLAKVKQVMLRVWHDGYVAVQVGIIKYPGAKLLLLARNYIKYLVPIFHIQVLSEYF